MPDIIDNFRYEHGFLSNFYPSKVILDEMEFPTIENAFQAAKTYKEQRYQFQDCTPSYAKTLGRRVKLRSDWETYKVTVMRELIQQKFSHGTEFSILLLNTGEAQLIENNDWGDTYWGVCCGEGKNMLGKLLMEQRQFLQNKGAK